MLLIFLGACVLTLCAGVALELAGDEIASHIGMLPYAQNTDIYLASLGIVLTSVYIFGLVTRPKRRMGRLGLDSWPVLAAYIVGIAGLFFVHNHGT